MWDEMFHDGPLAALLLIGLMLIVITAWGYMRRK